MDIDPKISLKLLIDDKRNKVVLAEADQDFVDVLISLLSTPMGKVAKLLEKHEMILGCFKNLNKSVEDMDNEYYETDACKTMLLFPKSVKSIHRKKLKLNMTYTDDTSLYVCISCKNAYSNFNTCRCSCGAMMYVEMNAPKREQVDEVIDDTESGVFVNGRSLFILTDDLKVTESSIHVFMKVLKDQGYVRSTDLRESQLYVGFEEMVTLLGCLFTSETPLTSAFLEKDISTKMNRMLSPPVDKAGVVESDSLYTVDVFVRKLDKEIMYVECNADFIDSLFSFLVLPLELANTLSNDNTDLRCLANLCRFSCRRASSSNFDQIPDYYICNNNNPFNLSIRSSPVYECLVPFSAYARGGDIMRLSSNDPKAKPRTSSNGFMKRDVKFIVSNDLVVSPMKTTSIIDLLKEMQLCISDLEEHQISISKNELVSILRASLISSSALTYGLSNLLTKKVLREQVSFNKTPLY